MASIALVWTNYLLHLRTPGRRLILVRREDMWNTYARRYQDSSSEVFRLSANGWRTPKTWLLHAKGALKE